MSKRSGTSRAAMDLSAAGALSRTGGTRPNMLRRDTLAAGSSRPRQCQGWPLHLTAPLTICLAAVNIASVGMPWQAGRHVPALVSSSRLAVGFRPTPALFRPRHVSCNQATASPTGEPVPWHVRAHRAYELLF